jgi:hypothetical protein
MVWYGMVWYGMLFMYNMSKQMHEKNWKSLSNKSKEMTTLKEQQTVEEIDDNSTTAQCGVESK